jgi:transposase
MVHTMKDQAGVSARVRRNHDQAFKDELIAQSLVPGASVSAIAMKGGINANLLFKWRREHVRAMGRATGTSATLLPVCVIPDVEPMQAPQPNAPGGAAVHRGARPGVIEVEVAGAVLRLRGAVDESVLGSVLRALRHSA